MAKLFHLNWRSLAGLPFVGVLVVVYSLPIYVLVSMSLKRITDHSSYLSPPQQVTFENYAEIFSDGGVTRSLLNTTIITVATVLLQVIIGGMAAYPLARRRTRLNGWVQGAILAVMMVPPLSILVGVYSMMVSLNATSTYWGMIVISVVFGLPLPIYMYANFIVTIPRELDEAAELDGCGPLRTFFLIIAPQLKPITISVVILNGVGIWNEYGYALYLLQRPEMYTMTLRISQYFSASSASDLNGAAAAAVIAILPVLIAYLVLQKYFVKGALDGAVKG